MTSGVEHAPWVGRPLPRVEDDALLRGEGRFLDDLPPVPHVLTRRSSARSSPTPGSTVDATAALALPGVVGVLTGADVAGALAALPGRDRHGCRSTRRDRHRALRRRADRGRRRARPLPRRGRGRARRGGLRPARAGARPRRAAATEARARPHVLLRRRRRRDGRGRPRRAPDLPRSRASPARPSSATRSSPTGTRPQAG